MNNVNSVLPFYQNFKILLMKTRGTKLLICNFKNTWNKPLHKI